MIKIKMRRSIQLGAQDNVFIGDRTYDVEDGVANALIKDGHAILLVQHLPDPAPEAKAPAAPAKSAKQKAAAAAAKKTGKAAADKAKQKGDAKTTAKAKPKDKRYR